MAEERVGNRPAWWSSEVTKRTRSGCSQQRGGGLWGGGARDIITCSSSSCQNREERYLHLPGRPEVQWTHTLYPPCSLNSLLILTWLRNGSAGPTWKLPKPGILREPTTRERTRGRDRGAFLKWVKIKKQCQRCQLEYSLMKQQQYKRKWPRVTVNWSQLNGSTTRITSHYSGRFL